MPFRHVFLAAYRMLEHLYAGNVEQRIGSGVGFVGNRSFPASNMIELFHSKCVVSLRS